MDPQAVLDGIAEFKAFIEEYGGLVLGYVSQALAFIYDVITSLPGWIADVWHFITSIIDAIKTVAGG